MSMSVGASSSNALSYLQSLLQQGTAGAGDAKKSSASDPLAMLMQAISGDGASPGQTSSSATSSNATTGSNCPPFSPETMAALLSAQGQQSADSPSAKLFAKLDADGDGQISKAEFTDAASKAGADSSVADAVFAKIDANGDGAVSQGELAKADKGGGHHHHHIGGGDGAQDPLDAMTSSASASGATTQTTTNADGSTTTTISYADGSKVDMTTPATAQSSSTSDNSSSNSSNSSGTKSNLLEQLIKLQSQMLSFATSTMSTVA